MLFPTGVGLWIFIHTYIRAVRIRPHSELQHLARHRVHFRLRVVRRDGREDQDASADARDRLAVDGHRGGGNALQDDCFFLEFRPHRTACRAYLPFMIMNFWRSWAAFPGGGAIFLTSEFHGKPRGDNNVCSSGPCPTQSAWPLSVRWIWLAGNGRVGWKLYECVGRGSSGRKKDER